MMLWEHREDVKINDVFIRIWVLQSEKKLSEVKETSKVTTVSSVIFGCSTAFKHALYILIHSHSTSST